jgi:PAS domain S-box-containing protein
MKQEDNSSIEALKESEDRLASYIKTIPHGLIENDCEGNITLCNDGYCRLLERDAEDVVGRKISDFLPTQKEKQERIELFKKLQSGRMEPKPFMGRLLRADGNILNVQIDWNYRRNDEDRVIGYVASITDVTRLMRAEEKTSRSESLLKSIMDSSQDISIWAVDSNICYTFFNNYHKNAMKHYWNADIKRGTHLPDYITNPEYKNQVEDYYRRILSGECMDFMDKVSDPAGDIHTFENFSNPIFNEKGDITGATIFTIDITARVRAEERIKQSLEEKDVLLKEIHHRVKNNLQIISSMLHMQADLVDEEGVKKIFIDSQSRIQSMSLVHEQLYENDKLAAIPMSSYIESLTESIASSISRDCKDTIETDIEPAELDINTAIPVGMILNELISNSVKHAAGASKNPKIKISLRCEKGTCRITVRDNGSGIVPNIPKRTRASLGFQLVNALTSQLDGSLELKNDSGLVCTLIFPLNTTS